MRHIVLEFNGIRQNVPKEEVLLCGYHLPGEAEQSWRCLWETELLVLKPEAPESNPPLKPCAVAALKSKCQHQFQSKMMFFLARALGSAVSRGCRFRTAALCSGFWELGQFLCSQACFSVSIAVHVWFGGSCGVICIPYCTGILQLPGDCSGHLRWAPLLLGVQPGCWRRSRAQSEVGAALHHSHLLSRPTHFSSWQNSRDRILSCRSDASSKVYLKSS